MLSQPLDFTQSHLNAERTGKRMRKKRSQHGHGMRATRANGQALLCGVVAVLSSAIAPADNITRERIEPDDPDPDGDACLFAEDMFTRGDSENMPHMSKDESREMILQWAMCRVARRGLSGQTPPPLPPRMSATVRPYKSKPPVCCWTALAPLRRSWRVEACSKSYHRA